MISLAVITLGFVYFAKETRQTPEPESRIAETSALLESAP
jgi:hypothetical protein